MISDYIDLDVSESLISGTIATGLKDHESLDMTLTLDKSYFSGAYTALSFSWVGMAVIVALLALAFGYWFVTLRSAPIRTSTRRLPPDAALPVRYARFWSAAGRSSSTCWSATGRASGI